MAASIFKKLARGLSRTRESIAATLGGLEGSDAVNAQAIGDLEAGLLAADLGPELTAEVIDAVHERAADHGGVVEAVRATLRAALDHDSRVERATKPHVIFVVGVNGGGKTTTVGKLAALERAAGRRVMIVAADTFRAAAIEQLERWSERSGAELVKQREGADPAAVVFDALKAASSRGVDTVLVDTAGRLHTKTNLMGELKKLGRIARREVQGAPHEVLLVVDATTGQNGLAQAEEFTRATELTGVVLTKLDGTAKGGVALVIQSKIGVPVRYVGVGEGLDDLLVFDPDAYVDGLLAV